MALFGIFNISGSALSTHRQWMDAISDNVANMNTVRPADEPAFRERFIRAQSVGADGDVVRSGSRQDNAVGQGMRVTGVEFGSAEGRLVNDPTNPLADENGNVRYPDIDLGEQMVSMTIALRGYQANIAMVDRAKQAYEQALTLGGR
jgi:flagellar basal-body rod protein FlgC